MKIFVEVHHQALFTSLQLLFEKRLGHELYRPIGTEWFHRGFWRNAEIYNDHPNTIEQFLGIRDTKPTKMGHRNQVTDKLDDYYVVDDVIPHKAITYPQFMDMKINLVIASYYANIEPYKRLTQIHPNHPKHVMQMGNNWIVPWDIVDNLMASTDPTSTPVPVGKNAVFYHQEFDRNTYRYEPPKENPKYFRSFVHCMMEHEMHKQDWEDFQQLEKELPGFKFESFGISCRDGKVYTQAEIADKMRESYFGVHFKNHGDGFGHTIFNWIAVGRPVVYRGSQYNGKLAGKLLIHGKTGFDIEKGKPAQLIQQLNWKDYLVMCNNCKEVFEREVNFEADGEKIKQFIDNLI